MNVNVVAISTLDQDPNLKKNKVSLYGKNRKCRRA
jgi:hypothetical protein